MRWPQRRRRTSRTLRDILMSPQTGAQARVQADAQLRAAHEQLSRAERLARSLKAAAARVVSSPKELSL